MLSLAARLRPKRLDDVVGQEFVVKVLSKGLESNRLSQVCLFAGGPGVGKTTLARILALNLVCRSQCLTCQNCREALAGSHPDILEFDAATNTGVAEVKQALESAAYKPQIADCKVFIIDEIHMLSKSAISSLLKIIEDTPPNVWFLFATTDIEKIPYTIVSRALTFKLNLISEEVMTEYLAKVSAQEDIKFTNEALQLISIAANGCLRAGLSILEQTAIAADNNIDEQQVTECTKMLPREKLQALYQAVSKQDKQQIFELCKNIQNPYTVVLQLLQMAEQNPHIGLQMGYALEELAYSPCPEKLIAVLLSKAALVSALPTPEEIWKALDLKSENDPNELIRYAKELFGIQ